MVAFRGKAFTLYRIAQAEDERKNYTHAIQYYEQASDFFSNAIKVELTSETEIQQANHFRNKCRERIDKLTKEREVEKKKLPTGEIVGKISGIVDTKHKRADLIISYRKKYGNQIQTMSERDLEEKLNFVENQSKRAMANAKEKNDPKVTTFAPNGRNGERKKRLDNANDEIDKPEECTIEMPQYLRYVPEWEEVLRQFDKRIDIAEEFASRAKWQDKNAYLPKAIKLYRAAEHFYLEALQEDPESIMNTSEVREKRRDCRKRADFLQDCLEAQTQFCCVLM